MRRRFNGRLLGLCALGVLGLSSCVDENYSLSEDIDLNVNVGGNLTIPGSDTEEITLEKIFDLEPDCVVKADPVTGDYKLTQGAEPSSTTMSVDRVSLDASNIKIEKSETSLEFKHQVNVEQDFHVKQRMHLSSSFSLTKEDVTKELVRLNYTDMAMDSKLRIVFTGDSGLKRMAIQKGTRVVLPEYMTLASNDNRCRVLDHHVLEFTQDLVLARNSSLVLDLKVTRMDFRGVKNQGLIRPGLFAIKDVVSIEGFAYVSNKDLTHGTVKVKLESFLDIKTVDLTSVNGVIDPVIDMQVNPVNIDYLPDFLTDEEVRIQLTDPRVFLKVSNESPASVNFMASLVPVKDGRPMPERAVAVGHISDKSKQVIIPAKAKDYVICVHQLSDQSGIKADAFVSIPGLNRIVEVIPDQIRVNDVVAKVLPEAISVTVGKSYRVNTVYQIDSPLQFDEGTKILYTDSADGWNDDAKEFEIRRAVVTLDAENTIPMDMDLTVEALDNDGKVMEQVTATVEGRVKAGVSKQPTVSPIKIHLTSKAGSFRLLDGIQYHVSAVTDARYKGVTLNAGQLLLLKNIKVQIVGGIDVDLN